MKKIRRIKKKRVVVAIVIALLLTILIIVIINSCIKVKLIKDLNVEINTEVNLLSFVDKVENAKIETKDKKIDTSKLEKKELTIKVSNKLRNKKIKFKINIIDTTKPNIESNEEFKTTVGEEIDLLKDVKVTDNSKEEIKVQVIGEYDFNKEGTYNLKYSAKDSSNNEATKDFVLIVESKSTTKKESSQNNSSVNDNKFTTSKGFKGKTENGITYIDGVLIANKTYSLPSTYAPGLLSSTKEAFNNMSADASALGFNLYIGSGFRSYETQKTIYNNYVARDGQTNADTYSARPGYSEHQSGLAFDVCDSNVSACITSEFDTSDQAKWINDNCYKYGLIIRYPKNKDDITGYMYESWHLRYVGVDLATKLYNNGNWITLEEYFGIDSNYK